MVALPAQYNWSAQTKELFREAFLQNTRLDHLTQVMGFHPEYLALFLRAQNTLMRDDGPLPLIHRHYIAIIAAARHQCTYLTHTHTNEYLQLGGDPTWLESLDNVPTKLRNLQEINRLLAHRPWLVTRAHIEGLCRCGSSSWSLSELTQAIVLLTHFHSLCSAVFGCGINFELDDGAGRLFHSDGESYSDSDSDSTSAEPVESLLERLHKLDTNETEEGSPLEPKVYEDIATQTAELQAKDKKISDFTTSRVIDHPEFTHADFVKRTDKTIQTFRATDYSWETHGFSICNRFYSDIAQTLDERFRIAQDMTYYTIGDKYTDVNTEEFRTAVWNYIHCIMGIKHDDYNYKRVNHLLERGFKSFIKLITCHPERVNKKDFDCIMKGFTYSEKIHVTIILLEARMQAELLYALRAVAQYMT